MGFARAIQMKLVNRTLKERGWEPDNSNKALTESIDFSSGAVGVKPVDVIYGLSIYANCYNGTLQDKRGDWVWK